MKISAEDIRKATNDLKEAKRKQFNTLPNWHGIPKIKFIYRGISDPLIVYHRKCFNATKVEDIFLNDFYENVVQKNPSIEKNNDEFYDAFDKYMYDRQDDIRALLNKTFKNRRESA